MATMPRRYTSVGQLQKMGGNHHGIPVMPSARFTEFTRNNNKLVDTGGASAAGLGKSAATISYYDSILAPPRGRIKAANELAMRSSANKQGLVDAYNSVKSSPSAFSYQHNFAPRKRTNLQTGSMDMLPMQQP